MPEYKNVLVKNCLEKSRQALSDAEYGLKDERKSLVLNRLYYSVFYSVSALGNNDNYITSKHSQLMGWFNKKYIYEKKIFDKRMSEIYKAAFINRQESDYDITGLKEFSLDQLKSFLADVQYFTNRITAFLQSER